MKSWCSAPLKTYKFNFLPVANTYLNSYDLLKSSIIALESCPKIYSDCAPYLSMPVTILLKRRSLLSSAFVCSHRCAHACFACSDSGLLVSTPVHILLYRRFLHSARVHSRLLHHGFYTVHTCTRVCCTMVIKWYADN